MQDCQQFERRLQYLMDSRIDPETDQLLCAHSAICNDCHESLMTYSLLHTSYLKDSDSMKIKLENLGLQEVFLRRKPKSVGRNWGFVVASIAAIVLVFAALAGSSLLLQLNESVPVAVKELDRHGSERSVVPSFRDMSFESFVRVQEDLGQNDLYQLSTDLPGLRPLKALAHCLNWVQQSWFGAEPLDDDQPAAGIEIGENYEDVNRLHETIFLQLAAR